MSEKFTLTKHNGRSGQNGVYNPKHNDRSFNISGSEHIDPERMKQNIYWDWIRGYSGWEDHNSEEDILNLRFENVEKQFYNYQYTDFCEAQHKRNRKAGHSKRNRSTDDLRLSKKTCPEESLIQIGSMENHVKPEVLLMIAQEYFTEYEKRFGKHIHILDWGLHCDESTPHIHERHVFDCENRYGEIAPQQEKALEALDIPLPFPDQPNSKTNNRKVMFDSICRTMLIDIAKSHGLVIQEEPQYGGRSYLEKQDYILMRQKEKLAEQEQKLTETQNDLDRKEDDLLKAERELHDKHTAIDKVDAALQEKAEKLKDLTIRTEDLESFVEEVSDTAYDKAVEVVTMTVQQKTRKADYDIIRKFRDHDIDHDPTLTAKGKSLLKRHTGKLMERFRGMTQQITNMLIRTLHDPQKKDIYIEPIRVSIRDQLAKAQKEADARNAQRRSVARSMKKRENASEHEYL